MESEERYLWSQISQHVDRFFTAEAQSFFDKTTIIFTTLSDADQLNKKCIAILTDFPISDPFTNIYRVPFNGTFVTLWNPLPKPTSGSWRCIPDDQSPVWYQNQTGTLIPAYNMFNNVLGLLSFREEREIKKRDRHARFTATMSPRYAAGLLEIPAFNEAVALIVDACYGINNHGTPGFSLNNLVKRPTVVLSHDVDLILGNDFWTQTIRLFRMFKPMTNFHLPDLKNLWWMLINFLNPKEYYMHDILRLVDSERRYGFTSSFYFINGRGGRFGARSGAALISEAIQQIPDEWDVGIHYNYNTFYDTEKLRLQVKELEKLALKKNVSGRAHYLRFDPEISFHSFIDNGILYDESAGYPDKIGFRCGIAGPFQPYDSKHNAALPIWELPLAVMDSTLVEQYPDDPVGAFDRILKHISKIGGSLSFIFHPGLYCNPEFPSLNGLYNQLLEVISASGASGMSFAAFMAEQRHNQ